MRRSLAALTLLLAAASCYTRPAQPTPAAPVRPKLAGKAGTYLRHVNMSLPYRTGRYCDWPAHLTVKTMLSHVGRAGGYPRAAALVQVLAIGQPRWNTADGHRPTTVEANAMIDKMGVRPSIYRPITFRINHVYAGPLPSVTFLAFAETGKIGQDEIFSCAFGSPTRLGIREGPSVVTVGAAYVAFFAEEMLTGRDVGPLGMPVIDNLFEVRGSMVIGLDETPEPLGS